VIGSGCGHSPYLSKRGVARRVALRPATAVHGWRRLVAPVRAQASRCHSRPARVAHRRRAAWLSGLRR